MIKCSSPYNDILSPKNGKSIKEIVVSKGISVAFRLFTDKESSPYNDILSP